MNYYLVTTKCGHVGKNRYIPITFPVMAETGKEAAVIARQMPRVKHHHWDAILNCKKVNERLYKKQMRINDNDPYLQVKSKHEQNQIQDLIEIRLVVDNHQSEITMTNKRSSKPNLQFQMKKYINRLDDLDITELAISY